MKEQIKPIYAVTHDRGAPHRLYPVWFCEKPFTYIDWHQAYAIVVYKPLDNPKRPFHIIKDRFLSTYEPMTRNEFAVYVDAWNDVINEINANAK